MKNLYQYLFFFFLLLLLLPFIFLQQTQAADVACPPNNNEPDFIHTSCNATQFPQLCYDSLSRFRKSIKSNPTRLARVAVVVSLSISRRTAAYVAKLAPQADPKLSGPLNDCSSLFEDVVAEIADSLDQMKTLASGTGSLRFKLSNVQTWMSAALTSAETCTDGFQDVEDGPMKTDVLDRAGFVKKFMSNALAMVNNVANNVS